MTFVSLQPVHGVHVVIRELRTLVIGISGGRFLGRFLFLPARLRVGERVWLRVERADDGADVDEPEPGAAVDVTARITCVFASADGELAGIPRAGARFAITIDDVRTAARADERTSGRFPAAPPPPPEDVDDVEPTEPVAWRASWAATLRDGELHDDAVLG